MHFPLKYLVSLEDLNRIYASLFSIRVDALLFTQTERARLNTFPDAYIEDAVRNPAPFELEPSTFHKYTNHVRTQLYKYMESMSLEECAPYLPDSPSTLILDETNRILLRVGDAPYSNIWIQTDNALERLTLSDKQMDRVLRDDAKTTPTLPEDNTLFVGDIPLKRKWNSYTLRQKKIFGDGACYINSILFALNVEHFREMQLHYDDTLERKEQVDALIQAQYTRIAQFASELPLHDFFKYIPSSAIASLTHTIPADKIDYFLSNKIQPLMESEEDKKWLEEARKTIIQEQYGLTGDMSYPYIDHYMSKKLLSEIYQVNIHVFFVVDGVLVPQKSDSVYYGESTRYPRNILFVARGEHFECLAMPICPRSDSTFVYQFVFPNNHPLIRDIQDWLKVDGVYAHVDMFTLTDVESDLLAYPRSIDDPIVANESHRILERLHLLQQSDPVGDYQPDVDVNFALTYSEMRERLLERVIPYQQSPYRFTESNLLAILKFWTFVAGTGVSADWMKQRFPLFGAEQHLKTFYATSSELVDKLLKKLNPAPSAKKTHHWNMFKDVSRGWLIGNKNTVQNIEIKNNVSPVKQKMSNVETLEKRNRAIPAFMVLSFIVVSLLYILYRKSSDILQHDMNEFVLIKKSHFDAYVQQADIAFSDFTKRYMFILKELYNDSAELTGSDRENVSKKMSTGDLKSFGLSYQTETNNQTMRYYLLQDFRSFVSTHPVIKHKTAGWVLSGDMSRLRQRMRDEIIYGKHDSYRSTRFFHASEMEFIDAQNLYGFPIHSPAVKQVGVLRYILFALSAVFFLFWFISVFYVGFVFTSYSLKMYRKLRKGKEIALSFEKPQRTHIYYVAFTVNLLVFILLQKMWSVVSHPEIYIGISKKRGVTQKTTQLFWTVDIPLYYNFLRYSILLLSLAGIVFMGYVVLQYREFPFKNHEKMLFGLVYVAMLCLIWFTLFIK